MKATKFSLQRGVTLLELLLALVVIAAIVFVAGRYFILARNNSQVTQALTRIDGLVDVSFRWVQGQEGDFCGRLKHIDCNNPISNDALLRAGLITAKDLVNPWNNKESFAVSPNKIPNSQNQRIGSAVAIVLYDVPNKACQSLVQKLANRSSWIACVGDVFTVMYSLHDIVLTPAQPPS